MSETKKEPLPFGQSQFSSMPREELQRQCERLYSALRSVGAVAKLCSTDGPPGYWGSRGSGGQALERYEQAAKLAEGECSYDGDEGVYYSFYRYADELLFESPPFGTIRWSVCTKCNEVLGRRQGKEPSLTGTVHREQSRLTDCDGVFRAYRWSDLGRPEV
jgi:hypothetical protein